MQKRYVEISKGLSLTYSQLFVLYVGVYNIVQVYKDCSQVVYYLVCSLKQVVRAIRGLRSEALLSFACSQIVDIGYSSLISQKVISINLKLVEYTNLLAFESQASPIT